MRAYLDTSENEIKKLKLGLMEPTNKFSISNQSFKDYQQLRKAEDADTFEENIRNSLRIELGWKEERRHFFYRKVEPFKTFEKYCIKNNEILSLVLDSEEYTLQHNFDTSFSMYNSEKSFNLKKSKDGFIRLGPSFPVLVSLPIEIEMDGFFKINSFDISLFDENEVRIIYNNVKKIEQNSFEFIALEIKLNINQMNDMISQLFEDKKKLEELSYKNVLYIGIVNVDEKKKVNIPKIPNAINIKIIILGISRIFFGRNMLKSIEWKDVSDLKELKEDFKKFKNEVTTKLTEILDILKKPSIQSEEK